MSVNPLLLGYCGERFPRHSSEIATIYQYPLNKSANRNPNQTCPKYSAVTQSLVTKINLQNKLKA